MGLFSRLRGSAKANKPSQESTARRTTIQNPFRIDTPTIGFLNTRGSAGEEAMIADQRVLQPLFTAVRESRNEVPRCAVLFLYSDVDGDGKIVGRSEGIRDIIKAAGAYIAVVASEHPPEHYMKCLGPRNDWSANITLTIDRKGDKLSTFFAEVFRRMYDGKSMLTAWVELSPQIPGYDDPNAPGTIMAAEAGHLTFGNGDR